MFNIGDRVVINSKMGNNIIPIIGTIVERFAGRENYHNGDTELCYKAVSDNGEMYNNEWDYYFNEFDGDYDGLLARRILMHKENIKRLKQKIQPDIQKERKAIKLLQKQLKGRN